MLDIAHATGARLPEPSRRPGVCYALTDDGIELPVLDVGLPCFAPCATPDRLPAIAEASVRALQRASHLPRFVVGLLARHSLLARGALRAEGGVLDALTTYLYKLGPDNLGRAWAGRLDRQLAGSISPVCVRLRVEAIARLLADGMASALERRSNRRVHLLNLAGGAAADSFNALLLLRRARRDLLVHRDVEVRLLDRDATGPHFAARALEALRQHDGPLHGLDAHVRHVGWNWSDPCGLRDVLRAVAPDEPWVGGSSEGGLFEYAPDDAIASALLAMHELAPGDFTFSASAVRDEPVPRAIRDAGHVPWRLFDQASLQALAATCGFRVARWTEGNPLFLLFRLEKI